MKAMYKGNERYSKLGVTMDLLGIKDVSTTRQEKNGTIVWRLPIKINYPGNAERFIEVASFKTGYVRNQNGGYTNYQLNKRCEGKPEYFQLDNGDFRKFTTRSCVLIPNEIDRLEYLIGYCLKNYYIKNANQVANGEFISKWEHEYKLERNQNKMEEICHINANHEFVVNELQNKLANSVPKWKYDEAMKLGREQDCGHYDRIRDLEDSLDSSDYRIKDLERMLDGYKTREKDLENKLDKANKTLLGDCKYVYPEGRYDKIIDLEEDLKNMTEARDWFKNSYDDLEVSVNVNGQKYKVI